MFKEAIERVPFPVCGVALGTVALGNLLDNFVPGIRYVLAALSALMLCALVAKCILVPGFFRENMENPISASVSGTFPMTVMQLSALMAPFWGRWPSSSGVPPWPSTWRSSSSSPCTTCSI